MRPIVILAAALLVATPSALGDYQSIERASGPAARATFTNVADGDTLEGEFVLRGEAEAKEGYTVTKVILTIDGFRQIEAEGTDAWSHALDTRLLGDGPHELRAVAHATPTQGPGQPETGDGQTLLVATENDVASVVLFDLHADFLGAQEARWVHELAHDVTSLRMRVTEIGVQGEYALTYTEDARETPLREWTDLRIHNDGAIHGSTSITNDPWLEAPGFLVLEAAAVGVGKVRIIVDAVRVA